MRRAGFVAITTLVGSVLGAPNPWGSPLDWPRDCRPCLRTAYEVCGGGYASINEMISCVCTGNSMSTVAKCLEKDSCPEDASKELGETMEAYCLRYTTTGSWVTKTATMGDPTEAGTVPASATATETTAGTGTAAETVSPTPTDDAADKRGAAWAAALMVAGGAIAFGL